MRCLCSPLSGTVFLSFSLLIIIVCDFIEILVFVQLRISCNESCSSIIRNKIENLETISIHALRSGVATKFKRWGGGYFSYFFKRFFLSAELI